MPRPRLSFRYLLAALASAAAVVVFGRPVQTQVPEQPTAIGRVCVPKSFGAAPAGTTDPMWFLSQGKIVVGSDSNLYTTSPSGGKTGNGTIFRISPTGDLKVLFNFDRTNGTQPQGGLSDGGDGWFYGTTYGGGRLGVGTIFRIRPTDTAPQVLFSFRNGSTIGLKPDCKAPCPYTPRQRADISAAYPTAPPVRAPNGVLYGVTPYSNNQGYGVLYSMAPPYDSTSFHALCIFDQRMRADPLMAGFVCKPNITFPAALILGRTGNELYGTTQGVHGAVYRATLSGDVSVLHQFKLTDGSKPHNLMQASNGRLYGTTGAGGDANLGVIYELNPASSAFRVMSQLHMGSAIQGMNPIGGLVEAVGQNNAISGAVPYLYGNTKFGGKHGRGVLFRIPLDGDAKSLRVLHHFDLYTTGRSSMTTQVLGPKGLLYGVTYQGGAFDKGAFYALNPAVMPDVTTNDALLQWGTLAKNDEGFQLNDPIVEVRTGVTASQTAGATQITQTDGIMVKARCPNPHILQFIHREKISPLNYYFPDTILTSAGPRAMTTDPANPHWHTDVPLAKDSAFYGNWNAYLDQALGAAHVSLPTWAAIFDRPSFGAFDDPNRASPAYPLSGQDATNPQLSQTWRASARTFVVCNCQVTREVRWAREVRGGKASFTHIRIIIPAPDVLNWINAQLKKDGYAPIP